MRKFLYKLSYTVLPLWLLAVGTTVYYNVRIRPNETGDLGALGKVPFGLFWDMAEPQGEKPYPDFATPESLQGQSFDVLTVGDSFSNQGYPGYQTGIVSTGLSLGNYVPEAVPLLNPFQSAYDLIDRGAVDSTVCRTLVVETACRIFPRRVLGINTDPERGEQLKYVQPKVEHTDAWALQGARTWFLLWTGLVKRPVLHATLTDTLFTGPRGNELYIYKDDLLYPSIAEDQRETIIANIRTLHKKAAEAGIHLFVLVVPDKYEVYQDHIANNPFPPKTLCNDIAQLEGVSGYIFVGDRVLHPFISAGEKDVYKMNDSHWSHKAAWPVGKQLGERIKEAARGAETVR
ncbi:MAG: hypothetical protein J6M53_07620 [Bacteroidaceae bacterium]|nr:hypothetical protein [Bacteroidaceae bacterium]